jgi:chorismate lyase
MTLERTQTASTVPWLPAERLGQLAVDARVRPWLIGKGLLTQRMRETCGDRFAIRLVDQYTGLLTAACASALRVADLAGLIRDVELFNGADVWAFEQSVTPDSTLCVHPWLAELGDASLGETLSDLSGVERSSYEYAWLPVENPVTARALRDAEIKPAGLWARRARVSLRGAPLLIQEVFLPVLGRA